MNDFKNTSDWKIKSRSTLSYTYQHGGKEHEGTSEKVPNRLHLKLESISVLNDTSWEIEEDDSPEGESGFYTREYITGFGALTDCRLHAINLNELENETFTKLKIGIYPTELNKLQETAKISTLSIIGEEERKPEEGWMKDEIGRIHYHSVGKYYDTSELLATLFLSKEKFKDLVLAIKNGAIRTVHLEIIADVFELGYEMLGADLPGHYYNFAILCEDEGNDTWGEPKGSRGKTNARLQNVLLEWSPPLKNNSPLLGDEPNEENFLETDLDAVETAYRHDETKMQKEVSRLSNDVQGIRSRIEMFYQAAIVVVVFLVVRQVLGWIGF